MKKFITFTLCLLLCMASFGLTACGNDNKKEKVDTSIASIGNGGMVVVRGDYVYFVNGYNTYSTYNKNNLDKKFEVGGLYRAKLNAEGQLSYTDNGSVEGAQRLSDNLVGFESTSLYVFGNYIYYVNPITEVDKDGNLQTSKLEFNRVKIGGGKSERVYHTKHEASSVEFEFYYAEDSVYLLIKDGTTLKRINCYGKFSSSTIARNVNSVVLPRDADDVFESDSYKNIFYTKTNDDSKIEIYNYNIAANKTQYKKETNYKTCELVDYRDGQLYYKASKDDQLGYKNYYRIDATKNAIMNLKEEQLTNNEYSNIYLLDNKDNAFIVQTDAATYYLEYNPGDISKRHVIAESKIDIMTVSNNYIYYKSNAEIKRINYYNMPAVKNETSILTLDGLQAYSYDIDYNNLYVYATKGSNTYLHSIQVGNIIEGQSPEAKLLGVYANGDAPAED